MFTAVITRFAGNQQTTNEYSCDTTTAFDDWAGAMSRAGWIMTCDSISWVGTRVSATGEYVMATIHPRA